MRILLIDNYDSFTYNLVQHLGSLGAEVLVRRNDALALEELPALAPHAVVISPGPCTPREAGISVPLVQHVSGRTPLLGVCLGHQAIGEAFGGRTVRAGRVMHGKTSQVLHNGTALFQALPSPLTVMRYHSLVVEPASLPAELEVTARAEDAPDEIHAVQHRSHPVWGVQFHPESVLTPRGIDLLRNFMTLADAWNRRR
jgi:anthranilate synthase/aminodeoxychorismate synthase-like glutamine amidotransferase